MPDRDSADQAYANGVYIPDGDGYYARWDAAAAAFRASHAQQVLGISYGTHARHTVDLYTPKDAPKNAARDAPRGTVIFVHGGYWLAGSPRMFSHLAAGALAAGYACAMPSHTLAPHARLADMTVQIAAAIAQIASHTTGPLYLVGHSAGGHLVARMACMDMAAQWSARVARIMTISPLGDLAPLMDTTMNDTLGIDAPEAKSESPIHHARQDIPVTVWVGGNERPAFVEQAMGLAQAWDCDLTVEAGKHHFDVIEGLETPISPMMRALFS